MSARAVTRPGQRDQRPGLATPERHQGDELEKIQKLYKGLEAERLAMRLRLNRLEEHVASLQRAVWAAALYGNDHDIDLQRYLEATTQRNEALLHAIEPHIPEARRDEAFERWQEHQELLAVATT